MIINSDNKAQPQPPLRLKALTYFYTSRLPTTTITMQSSLVVGLLTLGALYLALVILLHATQDKREPFPLATSFPFFGPIIGGIKYKVKYVRKLRDEYQLPICTLRLPFSRLYIVNTPALIQAVNLQANTISFDNVGRDFGFLFSGLEQVSQDILEKAYNGDGNGFTSLVHQYLTGGPFLHNASRAAAVHLASSVPQFLGGVPLNLFDTVRHALTMALTDTVYGPHNPFRDPEIEANWLAFLPGISHLMYSPLASFTARKNLLARDKVILAFTHYFETNGHLLASQMIQEMYATNLDYGLSIQECAKMEIATSLALLSSGSITAFWFILHVISDASVLDSVRGEILANVVSQGSNGSLIVNLSKIKALCPIMMAVFHESMRFHSTVMSAKTVKHDLIFADTYLLKAGSTLVIPGPVVHSDANLWGATVDSFDHHRFMDIKRHTPTSSFRPFGSGSSMCPGRHFSTNVILSLAVMIVLQFDVSPTDTEGLWILPTTEFADLWNAMPKPDHDVSVELTSRKEVAGIEMKFVWGENN